MYIIPILALLWIPGILGVTATPDAKVWDVKLVSFRQSARESDLTSDLVVSLADCALGRLLGCNSCLPDSSLPLAQHRRFHHSKRQSLRRRRRRSRSIRQIDPLVDRYLDLVHPTCHQPLHRRGGRSIQVRPVDNGQYPFRFVLVFNCARRGEAYCATHRVSCHSRSCGRR